MLTKVVIRNFKRFDEVEVELGNPVLFVGPNDAGKTSALQALMLWDLGLRRWTEKRGGKTAPEKRPGVAISRRDLTGVPAPTAACCGATSTSATPIATPRVSVPTTCVSTSASTASATARPGRVASSSTIPMRRRSCAVPCG